MEVYRQWCGWVEKVVVDYVFYVVVIWWDESVYIDMGIFVCDEGVNSFKYFMVYKNVIMCDDEMLVNSFKWVFEFGVMLIVYVENGEFVYLLQVEVVKMGIIGFEGYLMSCLLMVEGEVVNCVIVIVDVLGVFIYIVYVSCIESVEVIVCVCVCG